ncbi:MAG TPA: SPOR domain-containing protein [Acidobacteriota bacterium]|nr:SPOR domain-containing protein [Acidobacteriota bacterium]
MIHALKNIAVRIWVSAAAGGLAALGLLTILGSPLQPAFNLGVAAVLIVLVFFSCGWLLNRFAAMRLEDCLGEATSRERSARPREAVEALNRAVILFDSFMLSPLFRRRMAEKLAGRIARFYMARAVRNPDAEAFVASYLWSNPADGEVAEYWLQHADLGAGADPEHPALADRIAAAQPRNRTIAGMMAPIYLANRRTDYLALHIYRQLLQEPGDLHAPMALRVADLFIGEGRADEQALEVYLQALRLDPDQTGYYKGLAACLAGIRETGRNAPLMAAARDILAVMDQDDVRQWQMPSARTPVSSASEKRILAIKTWKHILSLTRIRLGDIARAAAAAASCVSGWGRDTGKAWRASAGTLHIGRWAAVITFAVVVIISAVSTVIYIRDTRESPEAVSAPEKQQPRMAATGRYTIQVASFRDRQRAMSFSDRMMELGYPAYWGQSRSSTENIWYYVRVSRFEDIAEAREFGELLKSRGVIDDFYVANYTAP